MSKILPFLTVDVAGAGRLAPIPVVAPLEPMVPAPLGPLIPATRETVFPRERGTVAFLLPELLVLSDEIVDTSDDDDTSDDIDRLRQIFLSAAFYQKILTYDKIDIVSIKNT